MEYVPLGAGGPPISRVAFGCEPLGGADWGAIDVDEIAAAVREAYDCGVTLFDTADVYGLGRSEERLAEALGDARGKVIIATKGGVRWESAPGSRAATFVDTSPASIVGALEGSLRRLRVEQIGLYQIHWPDGRTAVEDTVDALARCVEAGKVRYIGCSNFSTTELTAAVMRGPIASIQLPFNLLRRESAATFQAARSRGLATLAYSPLAQGLLSGRYDAGTVFPAGDRRGRLPRFAADHAGAIEMLRARAGALGRTPAQVALRWVLDSGLVSSAIVGIKTVRQLRENLRVCDWQREESAAPC